MNANSNNEKELLRLCGLMVDGGLDDADMQQLSELLGGNASAREFYRGYMDAHARLLLHFEPVPTIAEPVEELARRLVAERETLTGQSSWWQFASAAAVVLLTGLNVIQSAGNLTAAREIAPQPSARIADTEAQALADTIGLTARDVKRMVRLSLRRD